MAAGTTKELTEGKALPLLLAFSVPLLLGNVLQQFYLLTDSAIVSNFLGVGKLAAVGASTSITFLILGFGNGCAGGMAIPIAQAFGARDYSNVRRYLFNALYVAGLLALALTVISCALCHNIIRWLQVPLDIADWAYTYLFIILLGIPCSFYYNLLASIIRALGDSKTPFYFLVFSTVLNIGLDLLFIVAFKWDVAGAAIATITAQGIASVLCYMYMFRNFEVVRECPEDRRWSREAAKRLLAIGTPMGLQFSITAIGCIMLQSAANALGTVYVTAQAVGTRIKMIFMTALEALGMAMTTYVGQNYGAGKTERIKEGVRACFILVVSFSLFCLAVLWPCAETFTHIFVDKTETDIIAATVQYLHISVCWFIPLGTLILYRYSIQGMGHTNLAMWSGVMEMVARALVSLFLVAPFGFIAVCYAEAIAWVAANLFLIPAYYIIFKKVSHRNLHCDGLTENI